MKVVRISIEEIRTSIEESYISIENSGRAKLWRERPCGLAYINFTTISRDYNYDLCRTKTPDE